MTAVIYGECGRADAHARVAIWGLGADGCELRPLAHEALSAGELELWIGAIGPLPITAERVRGDRFAARFRRPLEPAILAHFAA